MTHKCAFIGCTKKPDELKGLGVCLCVEHYRMWFFIRDVMNWNPLTSSKSSPETEVRE